MNQITINPDKIIGKIKELNGVGGGPVSNNFTYDATEFFKEADIPYCRTHDIEGCYSSGEFIDIHCIFKNFKDDENDPENYNFTMTDEYLKTIMNAGSKVFYRLGTTIEHQPIKLHILPPKDFAKYGRICSKIISHYNEGWANGYNWGIEYWEFWNEPDIYDCWQGTDEQFFEFYDTVSRIIKKDHPSIKFGGCAFCSSSLCFKWANYVMEHKCPCDFISYHQYATNPMEVYETGKVLNTILSRCDLQGTELIIDEWNFADFCNIEYYKLKDYHFTSYECAFIASYICAAQDTPISKMMYYDAQMMMNFEWNGIFKKSSNVNVKKLGTGFFPVEPLPGYYALKAWGDMRKLSNQIEVHIENDENNVYAICAKDDNGKIGMVITYVNDDVGFTEFEHSEKTFNFNLSNKAIAYIVDEDRTFEKVEINDGKITMKLNSFAYVVFE